MSLLGFAEGYERFSKKERAHFLSIAKGSVGELKTQVMLAFELGYLHKENYLLITNECEEIGKMLGKLMYLHKNLLCMLVLVFQKNHVQSGHRLKF